MLASIYGFATLYVPPAGVTDNAIAIPALMLTLFAVTVGNACNPCGYLC